MTPGRAAATEADRQRAAFLHEMCELLWSSPANGTGAGVSGELIVLPNAARPRLVVPPRRAVAAAAVRQYGEPRSRRSRIGVRALSVLMRSGLGGAVFRDRVTLRTPAGAPTIDSYLRSALDRDVYLSMYLGAPRANRKPVLQMLDPDGRLIGFAKIGLGDLAGRLVEHERTALELVERARLQAVRAPRVLHYGIWRDMPVLVLSALPVRDPRVPPAAGALEAAMAEVAAVAGIERAPLAGTPYWSALVERLRSAGPSDAVSKLLGALVMVAARSGGVEISFGAWHGDWTPWNMASTRSGLLLWDWERFALGVPVGYDALHHWLQARVVPGGDAPRMAATRCMVEAPRILGSLVPDAGEAQLVAFTYLAELATRQLADGQSAAGARLGDAGAWLVPAAVTGATQL